MIRINPNLVLAKYKAKHTKSNFECIVLNFHGIIEKVTDDRLDRNFHLYSSFEKQIVFLNNQFGIIGLNEFNHNIENNLPFRNNVLITFDDGYLNNLYAREIMDKIDSKLSFTVFVSTAAIGNSKESIWTVNLSLLLLKGEKQSVEFEGESLGLNTEEQRRHNFNLIRKRLKNLNAEGRITAYNSILSQYPEGMLETLIAEFPQFKMLSWMECAKLLANNTSIESHGVNHELLHENQQLEVIDLELKKSKQQIKDKLGVDAIAFAYPNGNSSKAAIKSLQLNDYRLAFTTAEGVYNSGTSPLTISRKVTPNNMKSFYRMMQGIRK